MCEQLQTNGQVINALNSKEEIDGCKKKGGFIDEETLKFDFEGGVFCSGRE